MGYKQVVPTLIAQDNNACIYLVKGAGMYQRAKHIDTRIYRVRELSASGDVSLYKVPGEYQPADDQPIHQGIAASGIPTSSPLPNG